MIPLLIIAGFVILAYLFGKAIGRIDNNKD